ncbi:MAG TPA: CRTAC1 family protein, partial [Nitrospira sp.]|nr:CRTAC1 family protein [Nitrospira sp.]
FKETPAKGPTPNCNWRGMPVFCGPKGLRAGINWLYRNRGDGTFSDVSAKSGISKPTLNYGLGAVVSDFDHDGWPDIYVACDSSANLLFRNQHDGTFAELAIVSGTAFNDDGMEQAGMGVSVGDYDHDGLFDLVKTNFADDTSTLYHNSGDGSFTDATFRAGLGMNTRFLGWGTCFLDFDHDGWKDLFMGNGHVYPEVDARKLSVPYRQERLLYWNQRNGTFVDVSAQAGPGILSRWSSRGVAIGDLDNDGSLEIVVNNMHDTPSLLKNYGEKTNWLMVQTIGRRSNRNGIGARVTVQAGGLKQVDEVRSGGSYVSQSDLRLHFGLGDALRAEQIEVEWPSGLKEAFQNLNANQLVVLEEGKGTKIP